MLDDLLLLAAEAGVAEDPAQHAERDLQILLGHAISRLLNGVRQTPGVDGR